MGNEINYNKHLRAIHSVDTNSIKRPSMPMINFIGEAQDLCYTARKDADKLSTLGYTSERITYLEELTDATRYAQGQWNDNFEDQQERLKIWKIKSAIAIEERSETLHTIRFALRKDEDSLEKIRRIEEGNSNVDLVQDIVDISILIKENTEALASFFAPEKADELDELSAELADCLAAANGERYTPEEAKTTRDQVYTLLKAEVDELREFGKFLFWKDAKHAEKYTSKFFRDKNKRNKAKQEAETEEA